MTVSRGPPAPPQAENFLDHRFVRLVYEGSGKERRDRDWRKSAARGGGGQGLIGRVTSTLAPNGGYALMRSEEHTSELQSHVNLVCRLLLEKKRSAAAPRPAAAVARPR